jgi:hypothetical protein
LIGGAMNVSPISMLAFPPVAVLVLVETCDWFCC